MALNQRWGMVICTYVQESTWIDHSIEKFQRELSWVEQRSTTDIVERRIILAIHTEVLYLLTTIVCFKYLLYNQTLTMFSLRKTQVYSRIFVPFYAGFIITHPMCRPTYRLSHLFIIGHSITLYYGTNVVY